MNDFELEDQEMLPVEPLIDPTDAPAVKDYIAQRLAQQGDGLKEAQAETQARQGRAGIAEGLGQIASGMAGQSGPFNSAGYDYLHKEAAQPTQDFLAGQKIDSQALRQMVSSRIAEQRLNDLNNRAADRNNLYEKSINTRANLGEQGLGLRKAGLDLRTGAQAAQASGTFLKDPVMKTTSQQLSQIDKGLGRLRDVDSGTVPFSTTIKADLEKDLANVISGGTSSSLGQLHRVEFNPYVAKWQAALDKIKGYQGNINAPEFRQQLKQQFLGLKKDIADIQASRSKQIKDRIGTAYSGNALATKAIDDNVTASAPTEKQPAKKLFNPGLNKTKIIYTDGTEEVLDGRQ